MNRFFPKIKKILSIIVSASFFLYACIPSFSYDMLAIPSEITSELFREIGSAHEENIPGLEIFKIASVLGFHPPIELIVPETEDNARELDGYLEQLKNRLEFFQSEGYAEEMWEQGWISHSLVDGKRVSNILELLLSIDHELKQFDNIFVTIYKVGPIKDFLDQRNDLMESFRDAVFLDGISHETDDEKLIDIVFLNNLMDVVREDIIFLIQRMSELLSEEIKQYKARIPKDLLVQTFADKEALGQYLRRVQKVVELSLNSDNFDNVIFIALKQFDNEYVEGLVYIILYLGYLKEYDIITKILSEIKWQSDIEPEITDRYRKLLGKSFIAQQDTFPPELNELIKLFIEKDSHILEAIQTMLRYDVFDLHCLEVYKMFISELLKVNLLETKTFTGSLKEAAACFAGIVKKYSTEADNVYDYLAYEFLKKEKIYDEKKKARIISDFCHELIREASSNSKEEIDILERSVRGYVYRIIHDFVKKNFLARALRTLKWVHVDNIQQPMRSDALFELIINKTGEDDKVKEAVERFLYEMWDISKHDTIKFLEVFLEAGYKIEEPKLVEIVMRLKVSLEGTLGAKELSVQAEKISLLIDQAL